jgi:CBS domain-containing protein
MSITAAIEATPVSSVDLSRFVSVDVGAQVCDTVAAIFTQRDILQRVIGRPASWSRPMREEMTSPVRTMPNTGTVAEGLALMNHWWVRSVPVVDEAAVLAGVLSFYTVTSTIGNLLASRVSGSVGVATVHHGLTLVDFTGLNRAPVVMVEPDDPLDVAVHHMRTRGTGSVAVVDHRGHLVGELTEFDLQTRLGCDTADLETVTVGDVMDPGPASLDVRSSIADGLERLLADEVSHVLLVGESGRPVGMASFRDIALYVEMSLETLD